MKDQSFVGRVSVRRTWIICASASGWTPASSNRTHAVNVFLSKPVLSNCDNSWRQSSASRASFVVDSVVDADLTIGILLSENREIKSNKYTYIYMYLY